MTTRVGVVVAAIGGATLTASPALAHDAPPQGSGEWIPVEELRPGYYDSVDVAACGTTVTVATGDQADVEARETPLPSGELLYEARGAHTVDLTRHDTGQMIDELDVSGPYTEVFSADGSEIDAWYYGASILWPVPEFGPVDAAAFEAAGLPDLTYFTYGVIMFEVVLNPETGEFLEETAHVRARVVDLCDWFGDDHHHDDDHHDDDHHHDHYSSHRDWKD
jgi:hypothetical protein